MKTAAVGTAACVALGVLLTAHQQTVSSRTLLATVSAGNRIIVDLDVDDFVIDEGGATREVFDVHIADYPLAVILDDAAAPNEITTIRDAAARFITRVGERAVVAGALTVPALMGSFGDDREKVLADIKGIGPRPTSQLIPLEVLTSAIRAIQELRAPFSAIVVISSRAIDPGDLKSPELLKPILDGRIPVHVIANRAQANGALPPPADVLREVSSLTHGQYTTIYSPASYSIALDRLADRLSSEMMIQFLVPSGSSEAGEVRVGVKIPGARVTGLGVSR